MKEKNCFKEEVLGSFLEWVRLCYVLLHIITDCGKLNNVED